VSDAWDDEGFGAEDDWQGDESVGADLEDELGGFDDPEEDEATEDASVEEGDD
jgi:hypothetical protein